MELTAEALFAAGARRVLLPFDGAPEITSPGELRRLLARPVPRRSMQLYSMHLMGTARMSEDSRRGVTGGFGGFYGVPGLFVADASLFPGPTGINPMETVIALAMRNAQRLIEDRHRWGIYRGLEAAQTRPAPPARSSSQRRSCSRSGRRRGGGNPCRTGTPGRP